MICRKNEVVPIECIVRGYLTGSGYKDYLKNFPDLEEGKKAVANIKIGLASYKTKKWKAALEQLEPIYMKYSKILAETTEKLNKQDWKTRTEEKKLLSISLITSSYVSLLSSRRPAAYRQKGMPCSSVIREPTAKTLRYSATLSST